MGILAIEHVQLAMPPGGEEAARRFYVHGLGLEEVPKPEPLRARGGAWFERGPVKVHLGVEADHVPAKKAHPAFVVEGLPTLLERCRALGARVVDDGSLPGFDRAYVFDPFGNRIELMEPTAARG